MKTKLFTAYTRKRDNASLTIGLDVQELEAFLVETIQTYTNDDELFMASEFYRGLIEEYHGRICKGGKEWYEQETGKILIVLNKFLSLSITPPPPPEITAQAHSLMGLIYEMQHERQCAIKSFLRAMWILSAADNDASDKHALLTNIALTEHRLGLAYGRNGDYDEAIAVLKNAIQKYKKVLVGDQNNRKILTQAREELEKYQRCSSMHFFISQCNVHGIHSTATGNPRIGCK